MSYPSAELDEANLSFNQAFETQNIAAMAELWWFDPRASRSHPGRAPLHGYEEILNSWDMMFRAQPPWSMVVSEEYFVIDSTLEWCTQSENLMTMTGVVGAASATNTFVRDETDRRKIVGCHGSSMTTRR